MMLETRYLSPSRIAADTTRLLLDWLLGHGADEFTVAVRALAGEPAPVADAFEDALEPFALPIASRRVWCAAAGADVTRPVRRWGFTADSLAALLEFLPRGLFQSHTGPRGWLEDLTVYRQGELVLSVVTHEREGVLRLSSAEYAELHSLGIAVSSTSH